MDWTMILNGVAWVIGLVSGGFLAYGGWLCMLYLAGGHEWRRDVQQTGLLERHRLVI